MLALAINDLVGSVVVVPMDVNMYLTNFACLQNLGWFFNLIYLMILGVQKVEENASESGMTFKFCFDSRMPYVMFSFKDILHCLKKSVPVSQFSQVWKETEVETSWL